MNKPYPLIIAHVLNLIKTVALITLQGCGEKWSHELAHICCWRLKQFLMTNIPANAKIVFWLLPDQSDWLQQP